MFAYRRALTQKALPRIRRATAHFGLAEPDWDAVVQATTSGALRRTVIVTALEAVACFADLDESELRNLGPDPYLDRCFAAETALLDALWWQALLSGPVTGCSARMARYRKVRDALLRRSYQLLTMQRREGARAFALMTLSVVHHEVSGAALAAECSTGHDWA
ncbi:MULTISPECIES: hypothetical protein [unclassified Streptomyces]|uniref:hypothetical protein n=1 Tax=unclassified Streptomyces TaxID=2593676 RepID=UPI00081DF59C|nr:MULTISPECIES: hypothetical protein [unclassified Streptomyces]MYZ38532.1 hypothetical protein [Streptomyces sp. SID4917]SCF99089.1 hypothetical protein GA0115259_106543 [Streptomyces sp. MnatMP-M17]